MRWTFALLACLALASAEYNGPESTFESNKEYQFKYEAQVLTGLRDSGKYVSAFKIESQCVIHFQGSQAVAQLQNLQFMRMVDELPEDMSAHTLLPDNMLRPIDDQEVQRELRTQMSRPFKFTYQDGEVRDVQCEQSEPNWSLNLKKGFLNVLELKLQNYQNQNAQQQMHPEIREAYSSNEVNMQSRQERTFVVEENGIEGVCNTTYTVTDKSGGMKKIVKSKDLSQCRDRPYYMTGVLTSLKPEDCEQKERSINPLLKPTNVVTLAEYEVRGEGRNFLISKALYKSQYMAAPLNIKSGVIASFTTQKLTLMNVANQRNVQEPQSPLRRESLKLKIDKDILSQNAHQVSNRENVYGTKQKAQELLNFIVQHSKPQVSIEAVYKTVDLVSVLEELPKETIKELINECENRQREIVLDLIPAMLAPKTFPLIKELLIQGKISELRAMLMIKTHVLVAPPTAEAIQALLPFCKSEYTCSKPLKGTVIMSIGTVAGKIYKMRDVLPTSEVEPILQTVETELKNKWSRATEVHKKIITLKAMKNSGLPAFLPVLEKVIYKTSEPVIVREVAVAGLQNYTRMAPKQVQKICLPIYLDVTNPVSLRTACVPIILRTRPSISILTIITSSLTSEPNIDCASTVFSLLATQAKTSCNYELARKIKTALILAKPVMPKLLGSGAVDLEMRHEKSKIGSILSLFAQKFENTILPNEYIVKFGSLWEDIFVENFMAGVRMSGIQQIEERLIGQQGILWQLLKKQITPNEALNQLMNIVREGEQEYAPEGTKQFSLFVKMFANEVLHIDVTGQDLSYITRKCKEYIVNNLPSIIHGGRFDVIKPWLGLRNSYIIPTPIGMPISLNGTAYNLFGAYGEISVNGWNSRNSKTIVSKNVQTSSASIVMIDLGVYLPMIRTGYAVLAKTQAKLPISLVTEIDTRRMTLKSTMDMPQTEQELFNFEVKPVAYFMKTHVQSSRDMILRDDIVRPYVAVPETTTYQESEVFGIGVTVEMKSMNPKWKDVQLMPIFMGKHSVRVLCRTGSSRANQMEFRMAFLCPNCPMTNGEKHQWLFESNQEEPEQQGGWGLWGSSSRRNSRDISFDDIHPDQQFVDPTLKYLVAASLKTKQASQEKLIAGQFCWMTNRQWNKYQTDSQLIAPTWNSDRLTKSKVVSKAKVPEYLLPSGGSLRPHSNEQICEVELFHGEVSYPAKIMEINTQLTCLKCDWHDMPKEYTPVQLKTRFTQTTRMPEYVKQAVKKGLTWLKQSDKFYWMNFVEYQDMMTFWTPEQSQQEVWLETEIIPMEFKTVMKLRFEDQYIKARVCPFKLPWSVPKKPITYSSRPVEYSEQEQGRSCVRKSLTKMIHRSMGATEYLCFSRSPVQTCQGGCRHPDQISLQDVSFICKPRHEPETEQLVRQARIQPINSLHAGWEDITIYEQVAVPQYCESL